MTKDSKGVNTLYIMRENIFCYHSKRLVNLRINENLIKAFKFLTYSAAFGFNFQMIWLK